VFGLGECATFAVMNQRVNTFVIIAASALASGSDPAWIKLLPAGTFTLRDGRGPYQSGGKPELQAIVDRTLAAAAGTELMIDYDHQSAFGAIPGVGGRAEAAGWVKQLDARDDGIWAQVAWTKPAADKIAGEEYRYISPLFMSTKSGQVTRLLNAALVNMPALDLSAVAASALIETE
jgi:phage I-like protein